MGIRIAQFLAIVLTALALVPGGAHLFALPNKIGMAREAYFTAQQIYAGWALLGIVLFAALLANLALAIVTRGERPAFVFALVAFLCLAANLVIFFAFTFPANQATANCATMPDNWSRLR